MKGIGGFIILFHFCIYLNFFPLERLRNIKRVSLGTKLMPWFISCFCHTAHVTLGTFLKLSELWFSHPEDGDVLLVKIQ